MTAIAATLQAFFTDRLIRQRQASPHTIAAYRDTLRLLLTFAVSQAEIPFCRLDFTDLQAPVIAAFLDYLEQERGNSVRTRTARLPAISTPVDSIILITPRGVQASKIGVPSTSRPML